MWEGVRSTGLFQVEDELFSRHEVKVVTYYVDLMVDSNRERREKGTGVTVVMSMERREEKQSSRSSNINWKERRGRVEGCMRNR